MKFYIIALIILLAFLLLAKIDAWSQPGGGFIFMHMHPFMRPF